MILRNSWENILLQVRSSDNTTTYLVIDHNLLIVLLIALHAQIFAITAQRVSLTLAFDAFCACLLCPMNAALPQSITEKSTAWILRSPGTSPPPTDEENKRTAKYGSSDVAVALIASPVSERYALET